MKELKQIIATYTTYLQSGKKAALATVVKVDGSAYLLEEFPSLAVYQDGNRLHNPIGLDIGAETPEEIALSIHERHEMAVVNINSSQA
jgi:nitroreductase